MTAEGATHILYWVPAEVNGADGEWGLTDIASYEAGVPQSDPEWIIDDEPRDIDAGDLTEWIAVMTGYPVTVEKSSALPVFLREAGWDREEPVWYVRPDFCAYYAGLESAEVTP